MELNLISLVEKLILMKSLRNVDSFGKKIIMILTIGYTGDTRMGLVKAISMVTSMLVYETRSIDCFLGVLDRVLIYIFTVSCFSNNVTISLVTLHISLHILVRLIWL